MTTGLRLTQSAHALPVHLWIFLVGDELGVISVGAQGAHSGENSEGEAGPGSEAGEEAFRHLHLPGIMVPENLVHLWQPTRRSRGEKGVLEKGGQGEEADSEVGVSGEGMIVREERGEVD